MTGRTGHAGTYQELIAFAAGELPTARADAITRHLPGCPECRGTVALYQAVHSIVRTDALAAPAPATLARIKGLMSAPAPAGGRSLIESARRIVADLIVDGRRPLAAAGLRGGGEGYALVYSAEGIDIDLQIEPAPDATGEPGDAWLLTGQVSLPPERLPATIHLTAAGRRVDVDATGMFAATVAAGQYDLIVTLDDGEVLAPSVHVG